MEPTAQTPPTSDSRMTMRYETDGGFKGYLSKWWLILVAFVPGLLLWLWLANPMVVIVDGFGEVEVSADSALLTYSLVGAGSDPQAAMADVNARVASAEAVLAGVASPNISKSQIRVAPAAGGSGFRALVTVGVKTANIPGTQDLISRLYSVGAVTVSQPVLVVDQPQAFQKQAYDLALKDAKQKAAADGKSNPPSGRKG